MPLRFVNPNFHVILIHYPLGVFILGVVLELLGQVFGGKTMRTVARWMIALGAFLSLPAATSGIYALSDVKHSQGITPERYVNFRWHVIYAGAASILSVICAVVGLGVGEKLRRKLYLPLLLGVVAAWAGLVVGAWYGGEAIYQQGASVALVKLEAKVDDKGEKVRDAQGQVVKEPAINDLSGEVRPAFKGYGDIVNYYLGGEMQNHLIISGFAFAFAFGALGLSLRKRTEAHELANAAFGSHQVTDDLIMTQSINPGVSVAPVKTSTPAGRIWLLAALVVLLAGGTGYWILEGADSLKASGWQNFLDQLDFHTWPATRYVAHLVLGGVFLLLALILAILAVAAPKKGLLITVFGFLLVAVVAAQVWVGVLLTFDSSEGPLTHFREKAAKVKKVEATDAAPAPESPALPAASAPAMPVATPSAPAATPVEAPKTETPKVDAPKADVPKIEAPKVEVPTPKPAADDAAKAAAAAAPAAMPKPADAPAAPSTPTPAPEAKPAAPAPEAKPADVKPADAAPAKTDSSDAKPMDAKPTAPASDAKPADSTPSAPVKVESSDPKPADTKPADPAPSSDKKDDQK